jgi:DNA-binding transcriptional MerR regulator
MYTVTRQPREYNATQLAHALGVSVKTIERWRDCRIIDKPSPRYGPHARYTDRHLSQGREWLDLRDGRITSAEVKEYRERPKTGSWSPPGA